MTSVPRDTPAPRGRRAIGCTVEFTIGGVPGVMSTGHASDGELCRVDLRAGVHGSALAGWADALATAITLGLQHGAPPAVYAEVLRRLELDASAAGPGHLLVEALVAGANVSPVDADERRRLLRQPSPGHQDE